MQTALKLRLPTISLKSPSPDEAELLSRLATETFCETFGHLYQPDDLAAFLAENYAADVLAREMAEPRRMFLIAWCDGEAVGFAQARDNQLAIAPLTARAMELQRLYVRSDFQGRGIGKTLLDAAIGAMHARGVTEILLSVWEDNHQAQAFYRQAGFERAGVGKFQVGSQTDREILMRRVA